MNSKRLFYLFIALIIMVNAGGIAAVVVGNKYLNQQNTHLTDLKVEASTLDQVQQSLTRAKKDLDSYAQLEQTLKTVVPQEKDQARTIREIVKIAQDSGISIASITFPTSTLGNKAGAAAGTTSAAPGTTGASSSSASTNTQTQKVDGINNVERLEITIASDTSKPVLYTNFIGFLGKLEQNRRTSQVSSINIQPVANNRNMLTFSMVLNVYIKK